MLIWVEPAPGVRLWVEGIDGPGDVPVLLVADADSSAVAWPDELIDRLAAHRPLLRYDHRDTGCSTRSAEEPDYDLGDLAADAVAVLDATGADRAHVVGFGMGGLIAQLLMLDHPDRLVSAVLMATGPLPGSGRPAPPGPTVAVRRMLGEMDDPRDDAGELAWRVAYRALLHGTVHPFDVDEALTIEEQVIAHAGAAEPAGAHHLLGGPPARGEALRGVTVPTLVIEAAEDPMFPPPNATMLAELLTATVATVPGLGHALPGPLLPHLTEVIAGWSRTADRSTPLGRTSPVRASTTQG